MLTVDHVSKRYRTPRGELPILTDVSLSLERGAAIAIMGPSGSGKSTLLYILGALEPPSSGTVTLDGKDPVPAGRARAGGVPQPADRVRLPGSLAAAAVLGARERARADVRRAARPTPEADATPRARALLTQVGLADRLDHRPAELSGGEKQRAALARALIRNPTLLLCDEPTGNLDRAAADTVADLLLELHAARNTILVVVTHSAALAERFPVRYEMSGGSLVKTMQVNDPNHPRPKLQGTPNANSQGSQRSSLQENRQLRLGVALGVGRWECLGSWHLGCW